MKVGGMTKGSLGPVNWANHLKSMKSHKKPVVKAHKVVAHKVGGMTKGSLGPKNWANHKKSMKSNKKPVVKAHFKLGKSLVAHKKPVVKVSVPKKAIKLVKKD